MQNKAFKLNYKRILIIGFAFFGIMMLWQVYNTYCPVILTELLLEQMKDSLSHLSAHEKETQVQWIVGVIMALDNIFALFLLPIFGALSDKTKTKFGKRMPYIVIGAILSAISLIFIPIAFAYNSIVGVILVMAFVLIFMNTYRNPAVSLMPDITPKPLRTKANGLINLVGYVGAIIAGALALFIKTDTYFIRSSASFLSFPAYVPFIVASSLIVITTLILFLTIKENRIINEMKDELERGELLFQEQNKQIIKNTGKNKINKIDLILLLVAIFLWTGGFNALETFWSNYSTYYIHFTSFSLATIVLTIASLISFFPSGILADKIGRKWTIMIGILLLALAVFGIFFLCPIFTGEVPEGETLAFSYQIIYFILFAVAGIGWAMINCCSYPMVVELASQDNVGKYTGYYYTSSMLAQSLTPTCLGLLMTVPDFTWGVTFPYCGILFIISGVVLFFTSNRSNKSNFKKDVELLLE